MDAKGGFIRIRAKTPRSLVLLVCLGAAFTISACGGDNSGTPATPVLDAVLDQGCAEVPAGTGEFKVLPAEKVRLRVKAAWPSADLAVVANGADKPLEKVIPSDTGRQSDLRAAGTAYWVPENIDPNLTPPAWTVGVTLPPSMRAGPLKLELISHRGALFPAGDNSSPLTVDLATDDANPTAGGGMNLQAQAPEWNRVELDWRDRGDEAGYLLERAYGGISGGGSYGALVSIGRDASAYTDTDVKGETKYSYRLTAQGCGPNFPPGAPRTGSSTSEAEVTTPREPAPGPRTGEDELPLSPTPDPNDDQFEYTNPNILFMPEDAVVTSVTNVSKDKKGDGIPLGNVRHTDAKSESRSLPAGCPMGALAANESTSHFNGQRVEGAPGGGWKVHVCAYAFNLDPPARIALKIAWKAE